MKVTELDNLWVANYDDGTTYFNVLVVALDEEEAHDLALEYFEDGNFAEDTTTILDNLTIKPFDNIFTTFNCDYAIC